MYREFNSLPKSGHEHVTKSFFTGRVPIRPAKNIYNRGGFTFECISLIFLIQGLVSICSESNLDNLRPGNQPQAQDLLEIEYRGENGVSITI